MSGWKPIAIYDAMKKKPKYCVFYVEEEINELRPYASLRELLVTERAFGNRRVTLFFEIPEPPKG